MDRVRLPRRSGRDSLCDGDRQLQSEFRHHAAAQPVRCDRSRRYRKRLWCARRRVGHRPLARMVDAAFQYALEAGRGFCTSHPGPALHAPGDIRPGGAALMSIDFWINVGVLAAIYGIFSLGLQLNVGFTGLANFGQAGFMAIGAYASGLLVVDWGWPLWAALVAGIVLAVGAGLFVGVSSLRLRADHFAMATIAFGEIVRYTLQNAEFSGGNQGVLGFDEEWRSFAYWMASKLSFIGLDKYTQLPLFITVSLTFLLLLLVMIM